MYDGSGVLEPLVVSEVAAVYRCANCCAESTIKGMDKVKMDDGL